MIASSLRELIPNWSNLLFIGIRVIFIALAFEFIAWYAGRRLENMTAGFADLDNARDPKWRASRRATLKKAPRLVMRALIYSVAATLILSVFGVPILPLSLAFGAVALLIGAAFLPITRDYAQGYFLLAEDSIAPGDMISLNGHVGQVEKVSLRATWLRDDAGCLHVLSNREARDLTILKKATGAAQPARGEVKTRGAIAFDPLAESEPARVKIAPK